ncbi:Cadherin-23 [Acipenser ruthenus]|uniref:Cadherin-23 n=1 Tax=Acipenser ruthenus TaxID=7906 RepID=A0A444UKU5_ACIRT|nr:Cadherin-23 [Acipenser ruthenus]
MVFVTILDENDNAPVFTQLVYEATFREGPATAGSVMLTVSATDRDQGLNGTVLYHIAEGNVDSTFYINRTTGTVVTLKELDYEVSHGRYTLIITATDQCPNPSQRLQSSSTVLVNVIDVNDVTPTFPRSFEGPFDITEGQPGPRVWTLRAQDEDSGPNGQVEYSIVSGDPQNEFVISPVEGELRVRRDAELDRENIAFYNITVQAKDLGMPARSSTVLVSVRVLDINDNDPILLNLPMNTSVSEGASVSTSVSRVLAFDGDSGRNALLTFNITAGNTDNAFYINETTGVVLVNRPLDRERVSEYRLTVTVKDNPENPRIARRDSDSLLISVSDENDNRPLFTEPSYRAQIAENSLAGTPVSVLNGPILAHDNDLGPNAVVTYRLLGSRLDLFTVDSRRGVVSVRGGAILDREALSDPRLELVLVAEDVGQLNSSVPLSITVLDENDNQPVFNPAVLSVRLQENSPAGMVLTQVSASDADSGVNGWLTYRIEGGAQDRFVMNASSGALLVGNVTLDREERDSYRLIVVASDRGTPPLSGTSTLSLVLEDLNDSRPEFLIPVQTVNINESTPPGAVIAQVTATDRDLRPRLEYYIIEIQARDDTNSPVAGQQDVFGIDFHSGAVFVRSALNRELVATFDITISVHDNASDVIEQSVSVPNGPNGQVTYQLLNMPLGGYVRLEDPNAGVAADAKVGSDLIRVEAVDADVGNNSLVLYRILAIRYIKLQSNDSEDVGNVFIIGETDGIVRTFDLFTAYKPGYFVVDVLASDLAGHSDTTTLGIYILRDDQRVKIVINEIPEQVRQFQEEFINLLSNITGAIVNTDDVQFHVDKKGHVNFAQTDMLIHVVNKQTNRILDVERVIQMIDENMEQLRNLFRNYNVLDVQPAVSGRAPDDLTALQMAIIILAVLLFLAAMLFILMNWYYRTVHKRKLKAIVSGSTGNQGFMDILDMPNTNKYSFEGANPVWLDPYCRNLELAAQAEHEDDLPENLSDITDLWNSPARTHGTFGREPQASKPEDDRYLRAAIQEYDNIAKLGQIMREGPIKGSLLNVVLDDYLRLKKLFAARLVTKSTSNGDQSSVTELIQSDLDEDEEEERSPGRGGTLRFKHKLPVEFKGPDGIHTVHGSTGTLLTSDLNSLPEDDQKALVRSLEALHSESGPYSERNARTESAKSTPLHKAKERISGSPLEITEL